MNLRRLGTDLAALGLLAVTVFVGLSLFGYDPADPPARAVHPVPTRVSNPCGPLGASVAHALRTGLGLGAYFLLLGLLLATLRLFSRAEVDRKVFRVFGWGLSLVAVCVAAALFLPRFDAGPVVGNGGYLGEWVALELAEDVAPIGLTVLVLSAFAAGTLLAGETYFFGPALAVAGGTVRRGRTLAESATNLVPRLPSGIPPKEDRESENERWAPGEFDEPEPEPDLDAEPPAEDVDEPVSAQRLKINPPVAIRGERERLVAALRDGSDDDPDYELPDFELLEDAEEFPYELLARKAEVAAATLEKTFQEFGLNVKVVEVDTGPVITQFELKLEAGLRLNKVTALADDLAIALRVPSVRVVAPIPGKNTVGVEVPNDKRVMVRLRELMEARYDEVQKTRIPLFVGKDVSGHPLVVDMAKMPHLLIAGRTGTGKSVCLNTLILSILMTRTPDDVKMLMIDPKMVELSPYKRVPHLMHPVITDMKKAEAVLAWAVDKMEERYDLLARCGVRHLDSYNKLRRDQVLDRLGIDENDEEAESVPERMPYIVIIADEMADMMMTSGKDVEGHIIRLAQKSRAVGIHLVLATQKPTVDVITGLIKSNLPARMSFQVASRTDSRVVLDEMGAERLLGNGDMLYLAPGTSNVTRAQGTYVSDDEINAVIDFYADYEPEYSDEIAKVSAATATTGGDGGGGSGSDRDPLYDEAVEVVIREQIGSVSRLQRFLGIGYGRAARLIDYMAEDGIVGEYNGSKAREVLYKPEEWAAMRGESVEG